MTSPQDRIKGLAQNEQERLMLKKALDKLALATERNVPAYTPFLSSREAELCRGMLTGVDGWRLLGGCEGAERRLIYFMPPWMEEPPTGEDGPIAALRAAIPKDASLSHRDILGALMGLGIERDRVGDILVGSQWIDIIVLAELADYIAQNLLSAGRARLSFAPISLDELSPPEQSFELRRDTLSSLRLDSLVASGFSLSREKAAALVRSGAVSLDHQLCEKPDKPVSEGCTVSARGYGKLLLEQVGGLSKKGRTTVIIKRYV